MRSKLILPVAMVGILTAMSAFFVYMRNYGGNGNGIADNSGDLDPRGLISTNSTVGSELNDLASKDGQARLPDGQAFILPLSGVNYLPIRDFNVAEPEINARAAVVYDVNSGRFLYSKNIHQRLPFASITKLMSAVILIEKTDLNSIYTVEAENVNVDGEGADLIKGEKWRGTDLFKIMLIRSSNDAALTFTAGVKKQGLDLVAEMNKKALSWGMHSTNFADPAGLSDGEGFSTASDLVRLIDQTSKYEIIRETLGIKNTNVLSLSGRNVYLTSTNKLLDELSGIILGKTGYTDGALGTMALKVATNNGHDFLISVVLGSNDRFGDTQKLIEWANKAHRWE